MREKESLYFSPPVILASIIAFGSFTYYAFYMFGKPICQSEGCLVVKDFLKVKEWFLYLAFSFFCWTYLLLLIVCLMKKSFILQKVVIIFVVSALSFDGTIFGYQVFFVKNLCWSCLGVSISLFILLFCLMYFKDFLFYILIGVFAWTIPFFSNSILKDKITNIKLDDTILYTFPAENIKETRPFKIYLFFSLNCSHCKHLLYDLSKQSLYDVDINLSCISNDDRSLKVLTAFVKNSLNLNSNPFKRLIIYMEKARDLKNEIDNFVKQKVEKADLFFKIRGFKGVPVMILKGKDAELVLTGRNKILLYLISNKILDIKKLKGHD